MRVGGKRPAGRAETPGCACPSDWRDGFFEVAHLSVTFRPRSGHTAASGGAINSPKFSYCGPYGDGLTHTPQERPPERGSNAFSARPHAGDQGRAAGSRDSGIWGGLVLEPEHSGPSEMASSIALRSSRVGGRATPHSPTGRSLVGSAGPASLQRRAGRV